MLKSSIESYDLYENTGITFSMLDYRDTETQALHRLITTVPVSMNPRTIAMLYYQRWIIEEAFKKSKSYLKQRKFWSSNRNALNNQMPFTSKAHKLMRVLEELS